MKNIIKLLPENISNLIAAGEVVQRPASVIKELIENSIDAGATKIKVHIKEGGRLLISVCDNGAGMSEIDAKFCFVKHATSKLTKSEDLFSLTTMGFRGEALASIAAVSKVEMETYDGTDEMGIKIFLEGSEIKNCEPQICSKGTKINVKNIFFNIPARRNFLKSDAVESKALIDEFIRQALSHTQIEFEMIQDDKKVYNLFPTNLSQRVVALLGENYREQLIPIDSEIKGLKIHGFVGKPEYAKKGKGDNFIFINKRFVKNSTIMGAVKAAYQDMIPQGTIPFFVIFIELSPSMIDINVHPNKIEVKFDDESIIFSLVLSCIKRALSTCNIAPALDFELNTNFITNAQQLDKKTQPYFINNSQKQNYTYKNLHTNTNRQEHINELKQKWDNMYKEQEQQEEQLTIASFDENPKLGKKNVTLLFNKYILLQTKSYTLIIDKAAAYFRILYEDFISITKTSSVSQNLIFPIKFSVSKNFIPVFIENIKLLAYIGFSIHIDEQNTVVITSIPTDIKEQEVEECIIDILETLSHTRLVEFSINERFAISSAKNIASRSKSISTIEEMISLVERLLACSSPSITPLGQKIFVNLNREDIESMF